MDGKTNGQTDGQPENVMLMVFLSGWRTEKIPNPKMAVCATFKVSNVKF